MILGNIIDATKELGITIPTDQASGEPIGGYFCPHNIDITNVTRSSAREAYYNTAEARTNLHLVTSQQVTKLITGSNSTGYGASSVTVTGVEVSLAPKPLPYSGDIANTISVRRVGRCSQVHSRRQQGGHPGSRSLLHPPDPAGVRNRRQQAAQ